MTNFALERAGRPERVDHRSYERQGVDREPGEHFGPSAPHMVLRGEDHERLAGAASVRDHQDSIRAIDTEIARLESARSALLHGELPETEPEQKRESERHHDSSSPSGQSVDDDRSWGR
jgi:hypothetical protein